MTKDQLIAALENATGPDRDIDREIAEVAGRMIETFNRRMEVIRVFIDLDGSSRETVPSYTASRDAEVAYDDMLFWEISDWRPNKGRWQAKCGYDTGAINDWQFVGVARTEPLARRIAEIKALVP